MARVTTHPGEFLKEDLMEPLRLTAKQIAEAIHVPQSRLSDILNGRRAVTTDTALRLEAYFGVSAETWMTLQQAHDLSKARAESNLPDILPCPDLLGHNAAQDIPDIADDPADTTASGSVTPEDLAAAVKEIEQTLASRFLKRTA